MADHHHDTTKDKPFLSLVVDPGDGGDCHAHQQQDRHAHQEQEVIPVVEAISSETNDSKGPPPSPPPKSFDSMKHKARIRCRMPVKKTKFLSSMESKPSPDGTLDICGPRTSLHSIPYSVKLKNDVETQIGLFNGILDYQDLHGKSPFDDINSMSQFFVDWFHVDEPLESIVSVIDDLRIRRYSNAVAVKNDLEKEAFLLAQKTWNNGSDKSVNVASGDGAASSNLVFLQMEEEKTRGGGTGVVSFNRKGKKKVFESSSADEEISREALSVNKPMHHDSIQEFFDLRNDTTEAVDECVCEDKSNTSLKLLQFLATYIEEIGVDPLDSDTLMEDFIGNHVPMDISVSTCMDTLLSVKKRYEQLKAAGNIGDPHAIPVEERTLMKLANDIWCDETEIPDTSPGKDHSNSDCSRDSSFSVKILEAILFYREAMLINPIENETAMDDVLLSVNIDKTRKECDELLASIRVVYENAKAAGLLEAGVDSMPAYEMQILRLADCVWGDINQTAKILFPHATDTKVVYDAKPLSVVYPEQLEQPPVGSAGKGNLCEAGYKRDVSLNSTGKNKVVQSSWEDEGDSTEAESVDKLMHHNSIQFIDLHNDIVQTADGGKYEDEDSIRLELLRSLADYIEEMGVDPLVSDVWMEEFIENHVQRDITVSKCKGILLREKQRYVELKSAGKIGDPQSIPGTERELMKLADNIWSDEMEIQNHQEDEAEDYSEEIE